MQNAPAGAADNDHGRDQDRDWNTYVILELVSKTRKDPSDAAAIDQALSHLARRTSPSFSVREHLTLLFMRQQGHAVDDVLVRSWTSLTGKSWVKGPNALPPLPRRVLARESSETVAFYEAAYYRVRQEPIFSKPPRGSRWFATIVSRMTGSAFWNRDVALCSLIVCGLMLVPLCRQILLGFALGLTEASLIEFASHLGLCHASSSLALKYRDRLGWLGRFIEEINLAHKAHHFKMQTNFRAETDDETARARVEAYVERNAQAIVSGWVETGRLAREKQDQEVARIRAEIRRASYGVNGTRTGVLAENILGIPLYLINLALFAHFGGMAFLVTSCVCLGSFVGLSMYSHRYLHMTADDVERETARGNTTALMRWYFRTPVARLQRRRHYRHHHESFDYSKAINGVIMWFPVADFFMKRGVQEADVRHLLKMRKEGH